MRAWAALVLTLIACHGDGRAMACGPHRRSPRRLPGPARARAARSPRSARRPRSTATARPSPSSSAPRPPARPRARPRTARPGGDTHLAGSGDVDADPPKPRAPPAASASAPRHAGAGNDAIERSARAQLYWELTQRCKDEHDAILPPESVEVMFDVDEDGYLVTSTISAIAKSPPFERAALCMRREVARSGYRAPPAARGAVTHVKLWVPSTD